MGEKRLSQRSSIMLIYLQVSWVRRMFYVDPNDEKQQRQELQLLTVGTNTFVADLRYSVDFQFPNNFRLLIQNVTKRDEGIYECQVGLNFACEMQILDVFSKMKSSLRLFVYSALPSLGTDFNASTKGYSVLSASKW